MDGDSLLPSGRPAGYTGRALIDGRPGCNDWARTERVRWFPQMEGETAMRWIWAAILGMVLLTPATMADTATRAERPKAEKNQDRLMAQRPKVEVRPLDEKNPDAAPFRIRKDSSTPQQPATNPPAASSAAAQPAPAKKAETTPGTSGQPQEAPVPAIPKDAPKTQAAQTAASDTAERVRRPSESGESSGNAVVAFWIVLPK